MSDLSRRSSRQPLLSDDTNSLTSFPDPSASEAGGENEERVASAAETERHEPLIGLLDRSGPSMFDDPNTRASSEAQTLSAAPSEVLRGIIDHRGAVGLVRRLAALLAERDAHITALTRLAEEFNVPRGRIAYAAGRAKQAEHRRLCLAAASEEQLSLPTLGGSDSTVDTPLITPPVERAGTIRGLTRIFGGTGRLPKGPNDTIRASDRPRKRSERPLSIQFVDAPSIQSQESGGWTTSLFGVGKPRRESQAPPREPLEMVTQHDKDQLPPTLASGSKDPHEAQWNRFLLRINEARAQNGDRYEGDDLVGISRFRQEGNAGHQRLRALAQLVLGGIPIQLRHRIWMELSSTHAMMTPGDYEHYLNLSEAGDQEQIEEIMKDVPRTLTTKYDFYTDKGYERLKKVLVAFVNRYEGLGYTQGLNTIAGYLLLAIPSEEDAFWAMCNIIENYFPHEYFAKSSHMYGPLADNIVLRQCIKEHLPPLGKHLDDLGIAHDHTVPLNWFFTAFSTVLPQEVLMRVWDVWLCLPNQKSFIFNIALTLLTRNVSHLLQCETEGEYWAFLDSCTSSVEQEPGQVDELIRQAFALRKKLDGVEDRRRVEFKVMRRKRDSTEALYGISHDV